MKRLICLILSLIIATQISTVASAENTVLTPYITKIVTALRAAEYIKNDLGLSQVDFSDISVANPLTTYEYTSAGFEENIVMYPLLVENTLVAWAVESSSGNSVTYQISTGLVNEINDFTDSYSNIAIIYDYNGCYLYKENELNMLNESSFNASNRKSLTADINVDFSSLNLYNINSYIALGYTPEISTRASYYTQLDVKFVTQRPPSDMCWAATIACIVNYVNGTNLNVLQVAIAHYGLSNFNQGLPSEDSADILSNTYDLPYTYRNSAPSDSVIMNNINKGFPIYASFKNQETGGRHAVTLYGYHIMAGYIFIMDPQSGSELATYDANLNKYKYVDTDDGVDFTFERASCRYW